MHPGGRRTGNQGAKLYSCVKEESKPLKCIKGAAVQEMRPLKCIKRAAVPRIRPLKCIKGAAVPEIELVKCILVERGNQAAKVQQESRPARKQAGESGGRDAPVEKPLTCCGNSEGRFWPVVSNISR